MRYLQYLTIFFFSLVLCCAAALPYVVPALSTAAQIIEYFSDTLEPQNAAAQDDCAQAIESMDLHDPGVAPVVEACDELTDAFLSVVQAVDQLRENEAAGVKDSAAVEKAKQRIKEYQQSYRQYDARL